MRMEWRVVLLQLQLLRRLRWLLRLLWREDSDCRQQLHPPARPPEGSTDGPSPRSARRSARAARWEKGREASDRSRHDRGAVGV